LVRHAINSNDSLWVDQNNTIFYGENRQPIELKLTRLLQNKRLNLLKNGDSIFYTLTDSEASHLVRFNVKTHQNIQLFNVDAANGFSISNAGIYYSQQTNNYSDIYKASAE
jgi:oligoribonuclease (3'-5' exoribonuclease)